MLRFSSASVLQNDRHLNSKKKKKNPSKPVKFPERKRQSLDYVTELLQSSKKYRKPTEVIWDD